jgi:hypothetical protein
MFHPAHRWASGPGRAHAVSIAAGNPAWHHADFWLSAPGRQEVVECAGAGDNPPREFAHRCPPPTPRRARAGCAGGGRRAARRLVLQGECPGTGRSGDGRQQGRAHPAHPQPGAGATGEHQWLRPAKRVDRGGRAARAAEARRVGSPRAAHVRGAAVLAARLLMGPIELSGHSTATEPIAASSG